MKKIEDVSTFSTYWNYVIFMISIDLVGFARSKANYEETPEELSDNANLVSEQKLNPIQSFIKMNKEQLKRLGWTGSAISLLEYSEWWVYAASAFVDETDATVNIVMDYDSIHCLHPDGITGWPKPKQTTERVSYKSRSKKLMPKMLQARKKALPWVRNNLQELLDKGWTRDGLFRAGKLKYPFGKWGIVFFPIWTKPDVKARIEENGTITWTYTENKEQVQMTARPQ